MANATLKKFIVVELSSGTEDTVFINVPRTWITSCCGKKVTVVLPEKDKVLLLSDPAIFNKLPSCKWPQYGGTMICETDSAEEAQQIINSKNNVVKETSEMTSSCTEFVTLVTKEIGAQLQSGNQDEPSTSSGVTNRLNAVAMLEIIQPIVSSLNYYIAEVIRINSWYPVINEKVGITNQTDFESILRLRMFSNYYAEFFRSVMDRHINSITANMESASPSADDVMAQNVKIINELMSTFIVVLYVLNGNIN